MANSKKMTPSVGLGPALDNYETVLSELVDVLEWSRRAAARSVNALMTATYWAIGRRIVEFEQGGKERAGYGEALIQRLSEDLTAKFGRGFSARNLEQMRRAYLTWPNAQTLSAKSQNERGSLEKPEIPQTASAISHDSHLTGVAKGAQLQRGDELTRVARAFPLPWSHYVKLISIEDADARSFYEAEALRGGWTVRQLGRQISSRFYERALLSKNKAALLRKGEEPDPDDAVSPEEEIKDPFVLEFLGLKDEYSENYLEVALIAKLETLLLELGGDFAFVGRQRRLRVGDEWYRVDLVFFHRRLRCLVVVDLKLGKFTHADAGQMHLYLNYAREHWTLPEENPPVGLILCAQKDAAVAHYALDGLPNKVLASEYRMVLPDETTLVAELQKTRRLIEMRGVQKPT